MSGGGPRVRPINIADSEPRPVLVPAGNKARMPVAATRKPLSKPSRKVERSDFDGAGEKSPTPTSDSSSLPPSLSAPTVLRRQEVLLRSNLSLNASCSSECSTESFRSRASTGRISSRPSLTSRRRQVVPRPERIVSKLEKIVTDGIPTSLPEVFQGKRRCPWVTPNTEPCYARFHDEEWGMPVHDDKKLFELLVLCSALAEHTWPVILSRRHLFREAFVDFDPVDVSKINEKKLTMSGSIASSLLSEPKLRAVIENARQVLKITEEFGSFDRYCWNFVNYKPVISGFRYPRQVPVKTPKADFISKDLVRRGFRCVGPTVVYSFMQVAGITNDHLVSCYRFDECSSPQLAAPAIKDEKEGHKQVNETSTNTTTTIESMDIDMGLAVAVDDLTIS